MSRWKIDRAMAVWGILFGIVAVAAGLLLFGSVTKGFVGEGVFLIVTSWAVAFVLFAKLVTAIRNKGKSREGEGLE